VGGKFHLKLNICGRPIANKYCEGKMKRTLKRELKVPEIAKREANGISFCQFGPRMRNSSGISIDRKTVLVLSGSLRDPKLAVVNINWL
jgi:hypothetical protein